MVGTIFFFRKCPPNQTLYKLLWKLLRRLIGEGRISVCACAQDICFVMLWDRVRKTRARMRSNIIAGTLMWVR